MSNNIFNISNDYLELINTLEASEGELTPEVETALKINEDERDAKMEAYAYVIAQKKANVGLIKDEVKRLQTLQKRDTAIVDKLKGVLINTMEIFNLRTKTGTLGHRLPKHNMFTRANKSLESKMDKFSDEEIELYSEFLDFTIKSKLTMGGVNKIKPILAEEGDDYTELEVIGTFSKTKTQNAIDAIASIEDDNLREERLDLINSLAEYKHSVSLTIR